jgi:hypothetical protein
MSLMDLLKTEMSKAWISVSDLLTSAEYISITGSAYNPATGQVSQTSTITSVMVALVDYDISMRAGTDIQAGDRRVMIQASDLPSHPQPGDLVAVDGQTWSVVGIAGDKRLFWALQVRK